MDHPVLTVVIPVYNDADALREAVPASIEILEGLGLSFEMILCEDASTDGSRDVAETFATADSRIKLNHAVTSFVFMMWISQQILQTCTPSSRKSRQVQTLQLGHGSLKKVPYCVQAIVR